MTYLLALLALIAAIALTWAVCTALAGASVGAVPTRIALFAGPSVRIGQVGGTELRLGLLPLGSSVRFLGDDGEDEVRLGAEDRKSYETLPLVTRLTIVAIGWVPLFLFAQAVLGLRPAATEFLQAFEQIFRYLRDPAFAAGAAAWFKGCVTAGRWTEAAAVLGMKMIAFNLLPLPLLAGGQILLEIARSAARRRLEWPDRVVALSVVIAFTMAIVAANRTWRLFVQ